MNFKPNTQELAQTSSELGVDIVILDKKDSEQYIRRVIERFKPFRITGHLQIGADDSLTIPLDGNENEFSYSRYLNNEPAYIFFDQASDDRNSVVIVKDATRIGELMENSFGMEYFVSNEQSDFLIAVNWYVIEAAGSAIESLTQLKQGK